MLLVVRKLMFSVRAFTCTPDRSHLCYDDGVNDMRLRLALGVAFRSQTVPSFSIEHIRPYR